MLIDCADSMCLLQDPTFCRTMLSVIPDICTDYTVVPSRLLQMYKNYAMFVSIMFHFIAREVAVVHCFTGDGRIKNKINGSWVSTRRPIPRGRDNQGM